MRILHKTIEVIESNDENNFAQAIDGKGFMHKWGAYKIRGKMSVGEVIEHVYVMANCEPSAVCSGGKCDGSGMIVDNMVESEVM